MNFDTTETEQKFYIGQSWNGLYRDRYAYDRETILQEAIRAWRLNPIARRLTNLFKIYNVDGLQYKCEDSQTKKFLDEFWNHELNNLDETLEEISNEIFLTGNLFPLYSSNTDGMTFVRIYPTDQIQEIETAPNDSRQELAYLTKQMQVEQKTFFSNTSLPVFMRHHTINKLAGTTWGEGEIWADLPWLGRYASWLEDRVRLNRYRNAFIYTVKGQYPSPEAKKKRQAELNANPPRSGTVLVTDPTEEWSIISPKLESSDASSDGLSIKKMIAVNHVPMHYLAEPESSTRTTADAAGTPTFKQFENHQETFKRIILSMLKTAVRKKAEKDNKVSPSAKIEILAGDATERDNAGLALAVTQIVASIGEMYDRQLIDETEYIRLTYRFMGETYPNSTIPKGIRKPLVRTETPANASPLKIKTDAETGETKIKGAQD